MRTIAVRPYLLFVAILLIVGSPILSTVAATQIAKRNTARLQAAANQQAAASREEARLRTCSLFAALLDAYVETPPTTASGRNVQATYIEFYKINGCIPPRTK